MNHVWFDLTFVALCKHFNHNTRLLITYASSEASNEPAHQPSLLRVFATGTHKKDVDETRVEIEATYTTRWLCTHA